MRCRNGQAMNNNHVKDKRIIHEGIEYVLLAVRHDNNGKVGAELYRRVGTTERLLMKHRWVSNGTDHVDEYSLFNESGK